MVNKSKHHVPTVGWVMISRKEVARAEQALLGENAGVRDELGLLAIHQAISDRLFPGTSVLHTRLRYALFVPWLMQHVASKDVPSLTRLQELETELTGRLIRGMGDVRKGIIGGMVYTEPAAQPASFSYWTALSTWNIFHQQYAKSRPSRENVLQLLANLPTAKTRSLSGDDSADSGKPIDPFNGLPPAPPDFFESRGSVTFDLRKSEQRYLAMRLAGVRRPGSDKPSLLARLATDWTDSSAPSLWTDPSVYELCDDTDRHVVTIARGAASLSAIVRGIYAGLVERECQRVKQHNGDVHKRRLDELLITYIDDAKALDLSMLGPLVPERPWEALRPLLSRTQEWLFATKRDIKTLHEIYKKTEMAKKTSRARLANTVTAHNRLSTWLQEGESALAEPLHFRWKNVTRLMRDLHAK